MKKIISISIIGLLLTSGFGLFVVSGTAENGNPLATHTVLGEYATATWCGYCKYAHAALKELYAAGQLDFYYVSLVTDKNTHAEDRSDDLGTTGYPTVFWDGGYDTDVGAGSVEGAKATYTSSINSCGARSVANIGININVNWLGNAEMSITVTVNNYESSSYNGYLRCYVTEIASARGWLDTWGYPYTFPFLDYAFDESITISGSGSWSDTVTWDGADYNDGYGNDFGDITKDNTFIIASVFASGTNYVDETAGKRVGSNRPPNTPSDPDPENGETDVELEPILSWEGGDPDWFDDVYYDVYFEADDSTPDVLVSDGQTDTTYDPGTLEMETTYYWQIVSEDNNGAVSNGPIWSFTTRGNDPPNTPSNPNPSDGATDVTLNADLSWSGGDPDGDPVTYDVYFGDSTPPPLVSSDQTGTTYDPGALDLTTTYYWKIIAEDSFEETSSGPIWSFTTRGNDPPYTPSNPDPPDGETGVPKNPILDWDGGDPDGDVTYYDVYLDQNPNPTTLVSEHQSKTFYEPGELEFETTYYWKIVSEDTFGESTEGPIWSFTVRAEQQIIPDLDCYGNLRWSNIEPGTNVTGTFTVKNIGEPTSELFWKIKEYPEWGTWTFNPDHGESLKPEDPSITVQVTVVAPMDSGTKFTGNVTVINSNDNSDFNKIPVTLYTPRDRSRILQKVFVFIEEFLQRFTLLERIITLFIK